MSETGKKDRRSGIDRRQTERRSSERLTNSTIEALTMLSQKLLSASEELHDLVTAMQSGDDEPEAPPTVETA